jgi:glycosyltransferase involved in cell wall biosynthesis
VIESIHPPHVNDARASPKVGVVIPLRDAAPTIEATLASVLDQTYGALEVIVVDDGSTDGSPEVVARHAAADPRVRLLRQPNAGVAAARNRGAAETDARFLAFIDADDLWAPDKIAQQLAAMESGGERVGLVYTWSALIDEDGRVFSLQHRPLIEGWALPALCRANIVGNGSSSLIRREAFEAVDGFDEGLRARGAQGCEDLSICLRIAERFEFRLVPRHLTGYRVTVGNMSSDALRMLRSCELVLAPYRRAYPEFRPALDAHLRDMHYWLLVRALTTGPLANAAPLFRQLCLRSAFGLVGRAGQMASLAARAHAPAWLKTFARRRLGRGAAARPYYHEIVA